MPKILVTTFGTTGDMLPSLRLCKELTRRGHEMKFAVNPSQVETVRGWGFEAVAIGPWIDHHTWTRAFERGTPDNINTAKTVAALIEEVYKPVLSGTYPDFEVLVPDCDFVLANPLALWAAPACERHAKTYAVIHMMGIGIPSRHYPPPRFIKPPFLKTLYNATTWEMTRAALWMVYTSPMSKTYEGLGLKVPRHLFLDDSLSPHLNILALDPLWFKPSPDWAPRNVVQTGFIRPDPAENSAVPAEVREFVERGGGRPLLIFAFGSMMGVGARHTYEPFVEVARRKGFRVLIVEGWGGPTGLAAEDVLSVPYAPYQWLFERASVVVHHGGTGTVSDCLWAGVPQIILAHGFDQPDNGLRVEGLGCGRWMHLRHVKPSRFEKVLDDVAGNLPAYHQRVREVEGRLWRDGLERAADAFERLSGRSTPEHALLARA